MTRILTTPPQATAAQLADRLAALAADVPSGDLLDTADRLHLLLDRVAGELNMPFNDWTPEQAHADRITSTAIFYMGAAVQHSADPAGTLGALYVALGMTTTEG